MVYAQQVSSNGAGAGSTLFWVDPEEELVCVYATQLTPSDFYPNRTQLRIVVNSSLTRPPQHAPDGLRESTIVMLVRCDVYRTWCMSIDMLSYMLISLKESRS